MDDYSIRVIPDTEGAFAPFISGDGRRIGFFSDDQLKVIDTDGSASRSLIDVRNPQGGSWTSDGRIVYSDNEGSRLRIIDAQSRTVRLLGDSQVVHPSVLPDGKHLLAASFYGTVEVISLETGIVVKSITIGSWGSRTSSPKYADSGHLLYMQDAQLRAVRFDLKRSEIQGSPVTVLEDIRNETLGQGGQYAVSANGTLVYASGGDVALGNLVEANSQGDVSRLPFEPEQFGEMRLSPDGTRLAICVRKTNWDIWVYDLTNYSAPKRLTFEGQNYSPVWSPDGSKVFFSSDRSGGWATYSTSVDASGVIAPIRGSAGFRPSSVSSDEKLLLGLRVSTETSSDIVALPLDEDKEEMTVAATEYSEWGAVPSPDERVIAYLSDEGGAYDIFIKPFDESEGRVRVSTRGGMDPVWSSDGTRVYFNNVREVYSARVDLRNGIEVSSPELLFTGDFVDLGGKGWDYHEDKDRFTFVQSVETVHASNRLNVISGYFSELSARFDP
jgi:Tol biopolymer transport system component